MSITKVGSLLNKNDREQAALHVLRGQVVGIFNRGVCALWFDGGNPKAIRKMTKIKGQGRGNKAIALTLSLEEFIPMIDLTKIPDQVRNFLLAPDLKWKIGSLMFIRAPLRDDYQTRVPRHAQTFSENGVCMIQNWDSHGHTPTERFLKNLKQLEVSYPAVTSMNKSNELEIVDQKEAERFCQDHDIPVFLKDPKAHPLHRGSYTIITMDKDGIKLSRDGNIPSWIIEQIFDMPILKDKPRQSYYPQIIPQNLLDGLTGKKRARKIRTKVLQYLRSYV